MKATDHTGFEAKGMVSFIEPVGDGLEGRLKQDVEELLILSEIGAEFLCNGKDDMPMVAVIATGKDLVDFRMNDGTESLALHERGVAAFFIDKFRYLEYDYNYIFVYIYRNTGTH